GRLEARALAPDLACHFDDALELAPLLILAQLVAVVRAREAALRRQAQVFQRHVARSLVDAPLQRFLRLERARLGGDEAEHDVLPLRQPAQRLEAAGALAVVFHEEAVYVGREHTLEHFFLVAANANQVLRKLPRQVCMVTLIPLGRPSRARLIA